jgi:hypothetical protein
MDVLEEIKLFDYENICLDGGVRGSAYCGAIKKIEELGVLNNIKQFL